MIKGIGICSKQEKKQTAVQLSFHLYSVYRNITFLPTESNCQNPVNVAIAIFKDKKKILKLKRPRLKHSITLDALESIIAYQNFHWLDLSASSLMHKAIHAEETQLACY